MPAKILILDIETFPNIAYVWKFYKENVGAKQVLEHTQIASFAYKWLGEDEIYYFDQSVYPEGILLSLLVAILDAADIVVAHNGDRFDLPTIAGRALIAGIDPPSPFVTIDTRLAAKRYFNFPSNSLEYISKIFGVEEKGGHKKFPGFELWAECIKGNLEAWAEMKVYNIQDVETLEQVYLKMRPFIKDHPNVAIYDSSDNPSTISCSRCGSHNIQRRGFAFTNTGRYQRYQCNSCGGWGRSRYTDLIKNPNLIRNV